MITIILTRHGQTDMNREGIFRGRIDIGLNGTGIKQAELLAEYLKSASITHIYSSPLKRAMETANIISRSVGAEVKITEELNDLDHGEWQGLPHSTVRDTHPHLYQEWVKNPQSARIPGGESLANVRSRTASLIDAVISSDNINVLCVSHRAVNRVIMCYLLGLDNSHFWNFEFDPCALTTFIYNAYGYHRFILVRHNDGSFMRVDRTALASS